MKTIAFVFSIFICSFCFAQDGRPHNPELQRLMHTMGGDFQKLNRQISDSGQNADSLLLVEKLIVNSNLAKELIPAKADSLVGEQREVFIQDYKTDMQEILESLVLLKTTIENGGNAEAASLLNELNLKIRSSHQKYR